MDFYANQRTRMRIVLLVLTLFGGRSANSMNLTDLNRVCVYYFPFDTNKTVVALPSGLCTAVSSYSEYGTHQPLFHTGIPLSYLAFRKPGTEGVTRGTETRGGEHGGGRGAHGSAHGGMAHGGKLGDNVENIDKIQTNDYSSTINAFKNGLPYIYFFDADDINGFVQNVLPGNVNRFADDLDRLIKANAVDGIVFDFIDALNDDLYVFLPDFQNNLKSFLDLMKKRHPNLLLGVKLHKKADVNKSALDKKVIDASVDFYVVSTYHYNPCTYHNHQRNMAKPPSPEQMQKTITDLQSIGYNVNKMFLTIQVVVKSWKHSNMDEPAEWSYNWMCVAHPGKKRKYCRGTLDNFYQQGKVIFDNKLPGVFIQAIDCDDFLGSCGCDPFPAARAINNGLTGTPENSTLSGCRTFGLLPKERKHLK